MSKDSKLFKFCFTLPVVIYSFLFIAIPLLYIFVISFFKSDSYGGMIHKFTLENYTELFNSAYVKIFLTSIILPAQVFLSLFIMAIPKPSSLTEGIYIFLQPDLSASLK